MWRKEDITYELFGIDPEVFYATKFADSVIFRPADYPAHGVRGIEFGKFTLLSEALRRHPDARDPGFRVLDFGCGSGRFGAWIRHTLPDCELHGIDMSEACLETCGDHGFDQVYCADFSDRLPFDDGFFDAIYSIDVFGHIEFRHKDHVVRELRRISKSGGIGYHGIESGHIDYGHGDPEDPDNYIRQYVWFDGHVGVEPLDDIVERFGRCFEVVAAHPLDIKPLCEVRTIIRHNAWGREFAQDVADLETAEARHLANALMGEINRQQLAMLRQIVGDNFTTAAIEAAIPAGPFRDHVKMIANSGGFTMLGLRAS